MVPSSDNSSLFRLLSQDWIPLILALYRGISQTFKKHSHEGIYEMLDYDAELELFDSKGERAVFKKRQKVRFLQDNVIAFQDFIWGDGRIFVEYFCSPGAVVDRYKDGDRWVVLISLREMKNSGDIEDFFIQRKVIRGFTKPDEWWQIEMHHQTRRLKLTITFPKARHCQSAVVVERHGNRTTPLDQEHFMNLPDGRQLLSWDCKKPTRFETYTIKWNW